MTQKELDKADALFERLLKMKPCGICKNDTCEECRWVSFAAGKTTMAWDMYNYFDGGHSPIHDKGTND